MPSRILPLSKDAISQINSSKQITSLSGVVLALLENALDADATKIDISVNFGRGSCVVADNGCGIPSTEFLDHGGLCKPHHTSKAAPDRPLHGCNGTYLASLAALSLVRITSRHSTEEVSATLTLHQERVVARHVPSLPANELTTFGTCGTCVSVNDLFGNMPVRVKQRALLSAQRTGAHDGMWLELKHDISALLLAWRAPCSVKVRDSENQNRNITMSGSHSTVSSALTERNLNTLHGKAIRYDLRDALPLLFQAGLAPFDSRNRWVPVSASTSKLSCRGLVCLDPSPTRLCQFISIGVQPCYAESNYSTLYESINKIFSDSSFGTVFEQTTPKADQRNLQTVDKNAHRQVRASKGVDRWPMFVLQLESRERNEKLAGDEDGGYLKQVLDVLEAVIRQWLETNDHRPQQKRARKYQNPTSPRIDASSPSHAAASDQNLSLRERSSSRRQTSTRAHTSASLDLRNASPSAEGAGIVTNSAKRYRAACDLDHLSKIRSSKHRTTTSSGLSRSFATSKSTHFAMPTVEPGSLGCHFKVTKPVEAPLATDHAEQISKTSNAHTTMSSDDFGSVSEADLLRAAASVDETNQGELLLDSHVEADKMSSDVDTVEWQDPITKEAFTVNTRTGTVAQSHARPSTGLGAASDSGLARPTAAHKAMTAAGKPLTLNGRGTSIRQSPHHDVPTFLSNWQNPVFARQTEQGIPVASATGPGMDIITLERQCCGRDNASSYFAASDPSTCSKLSKALLPRARVLNQVDAKFILCSLPSMHEASQTLVLVDQHAASERIILESLLADLCSPVDSASPAAHLRTNLNCTSAVNTVILDQPLLVEVAVQESTLFKAYAPLFALYGIMYDLRTAPAGIAHHTLAVLALPTAIAERCRLFPRLLIDLLRSEIWSRADSSRMNPLPTVAAAVPETTARGRREQHEWIERIGSSCPKALLDMLNSRACRSAVMFNDVLSLRECGELMAALAECAFPFMCAHGRVSMVPVGTVGGGERAAAAACDGQLRRDGFAGDGKGFKEAYRAWRTRD